jgi:hypothetical protein
MDSRSTHDAHVQAHARVTYVQHQNEQQKMYLLGLQSLKTRFMMMTTFQLLLLFAFCPVVSASKPPADLIMRQQYYQACKGDQKEFRQESEYDSCLSILMRPDMCMAELTYITRPKPFSSYCGSPCDLVLGTHNVIFLARSQASSAQR